MTGWLRKKAVVPIDFSDSSFAALDVALEMVAAPSDVWVLHVLEELSAVEPGEVWDTVTDETRRDHVLEALRKKLSDGKYAGIHFEAKIGNPGHTIADFAEKSGADVIVLPSKGARGLKRLLIGSVAERVVRLAHCPVVVLRH